MPLIRTLLLPLIGLLAFSANAAGAAPERSGFTGDLSIGASVTTRTVTDLSVSSNGTVTEQSSLQLEPGVAPLGVSLGAYLSPKIALLFRLAGTSYFRGGGQVLHTFAGPMVEFWPHDRWFLAAGVGLGTRAPNPLFPDSSSTRQGLAFDARAGAALTGGVRHALTLSLEVIPALYSTPQTGFALVVAWKWY